MNELPFAEGVAHGRNNIQDSTQYVVIVQSFTQVPYLVALMCAFTAFFKPSTWQLWIVLVLLSVESTFHDKV